MTILSRWITTAVTTTALTFCASAMEWHVYSAETDGMTGTQQLTNAFKRAQSGDTITIHAGTYNMTDISEMMDPYFTSATQTEYTGAGTCYFTMTPNLTIQGAPDCQPDEVVLSGRGTSTTNYGQRRPMHLGGDNCVVRNLKFAYGNANFTRYVNGVSQGWNYRRGGGLALSRNTSIVSNCVFYSCYTQQGSAVIGGVVADCTFDSNLTTYSALWNKGLSNCRFVNCSYGAISGSTGPIVGCTFVNCGGSAGVVSDSDVEVSDCTFSNCTTMCVKPKGTQPISRCTFTGVKPFLEDCPDVRDCTFEGNETTMTGAADADVAVARRCALRNCMLRGFKIHWGSVLIDPILVESCLIEGNTMWGNNHNGVFLFSEGLADAVTIRNCTIVNNQSNCTYANYSTTTVSFVNDLFYFNQTGGQTKGRFDLWRNEADTSANYSKLNFARFDNCAFKINTAIDGMVVKGENNLNYYGKSFDPKFKGEADAAHPYSLARKSPCAKAGCVEAWMASATDLAGNPRLYEGAVDIGCYQNCERAPGMIITLR